MPKEWKPEEHAQAVKVPRNQPAQTQNPMPFAGYQGGGQQWQDQQIQQQTKRENWLYQNQQFGLQEGWMNQPVTPAGRGFWENPQRIARYHLAAQAAPPGWTPPPWMDKNLLGKAYEYLKITNNNKPWYQWESPAPDDPILPVMRGMALPDPLEIAEDDRADYMASLNGDSAAGSIADNYKQFQAQFSAMDSATQQQVAAQYGMSVADLLAPFPEYKPAEDVTQNLVNGLPKEQWDELPANQQWAIRLLGAMPQGIGVMTGGLIGLNLGMLPGAVIGAGVGLLGGTALKGAMEVDPATGQPKNQGIIDLMMKLDAGAEGIERALGLSAQVLGSITDPEHFGALGELLSNVPAAWKAGGILYESALSNVGKPEVEYTVLGDPVQKTWTPEDEVNASNYAMTQMRKEIVAGGVTPEEIKNKYIGLFGWEGQARDLVGHMFLDPLNWLGKPSVKGISVAAKLRGNVRMAEAFAQAANPLEGLRAYGSAARLLPREEIRMVGSIEKWLAGYRKIPGTKEWNLDVFVMPPEQGLGKFVGRFFGLTPESRAKEVLHQSMDGIVQTLEENVHEPKLKNGLPVLDVKGKQVFTPNPQKIMKIWAMIAKVDPAQAVKILDEFQLPKWFDSMEAQALPGAAKTIYDQVSKIYEQHLIHNQNYTIFNRLADAMGEDPQKLLARLHTGTLDEANSAITQLKLKLKQAADLGDETAGKMLDVLSRDNGLTGLTGKVLKDWADLWLGDNPIPYTADHFYGMVLRAGAEGIDDYVAKWFKVAPIGWVNLVSNMMKRVQSWALLGGNPNFPVNNFFNNFFTLAWEGLLGFNTHKGRMAGLRRLRMHPLRLRAGASAVELEDITLVNVPGVKPISLGKAIGAAGRGKGHLQQVYDWLHGADKFMIFARASQNIERISSEIAMYNGIMEFITRRWSVGDGIRQMDNQTRQVLELASPGLAQRVEKAVNQGRTLDEIRKMIYSGTVSRSLHDVWKPAMTQTVSQLAPELFEELEKKIGLSKTDEELRQAFTDYDARILERLSEKAIENISGRLHDSIARGAIEGTPGLVNMIDNIDARWASYWSQHFARLDDVFKKMGEMDRKDRSMYYANFQRKENRLMAIYKNIEAVEWRGVFKGLGGENASDDNIWILSKLLEIHESRTAFFDLRQKLLDDMASLEAGHRRVEFITPEEAAVLKLEGDDSLAKLQAQLNTDYVQHIVFEDKIQGEINDRFAGLPDQIYSKDELLLWREPVRLTRRRMAASEAVFRIGNYPDELRQAWGDVLSTEEIAKIQAIREGSAPSAAFHHDIYIPFITELLQTSRDNQPRGQAAAQPVTPAPKAPGYWRNIIEAPSAQPVTPAPKAPPAPPGPQAPEPGQGVQAAAQVIHEQRPATEVSLEPAAPVGTEVANEIRAIASEYGIATASATGKPNDRVALNIIRQVAPVVNSLDEVTPEMARQAFDTWLASHARAAPEQAGVDIAILRERVMAQAAAIDENMGQLQIEAPKRFYREATHREIFDILPEDQAETMTTVLDAIAEHWEKLNGKETGEFYEQFMIERGGVEAGEGLAQSERYFMDTRDMTAVEVDNLARAITRQGIDAVRQAISWEPTRNMRLRLIDAVHKIDPQMAEKLALEPGALFQTAPQQWYFSNLTATIEQKMPNEASVEQIRGLLKGVVKEDELKWTGLDEWLKEHKTATKQEVLDYLRENQVEVKEVVKDDSAVNAKTKYQTYTLPGGENYRELLLIPARKVGVSQDGLNKLAMNRYEKPFAELSPGQKDYLMWKVGGTGPDYIFPHWQEPDVVAHVRFNDRVDADGKRVLFIEEIQSDWHQAGREKGYQTADQLKTQYNNLGKKFQEIEANEPRLVAINKRIKELIAENDTIKWGEPGKRDKWHEIRSAINTAEEERSKILETVPEIQEINRQQSALMKIIETGGGVPAAPFSKSWEELTIKRMIRWAAENDYDRIAWTTGKMQTDRYNLAKQVDHITTIKQSDGKYRVTAISKDKSYAVIDEVFPPKKLPNVIGKELAEKTVSAEKDVNNWAGDDLTVGDKGMKIFYDEMLPAIAQKIIKKWGGKVGETEIGKQPPATVGGIKFGETTGAKVPSFDITPEMKASVMQGQPLFQGVKGLTRWLDNGKAVIHAFESADISTLVHETAHVWLPMLPDDDLVTVTRWLGEQGIKDLPDGWQVGIDTHVKAKELFARAFERYLADGVAPKPELVRVFEQFKSWLVGIYKAITGSDIDVKLNDEMRAMFDKWMGGEGKVLAQADTLEEVALAIFEALQKDLMAGKKVVVAGYAKPLILSDPESIRLMGKTIEVYRGNKWLSMTQNQLDNWAANRGLEGPLEWTKRTTPAVVPVDQSAVLRGREDAIIASDTEGRRFDIIVRKPREHQKQLVTEYEKLRKEIIRQFNVRDAEIAAKAGLTKPGQTTMFGAGEDLPLFSGTAQKAAGEVFAPPEVTRQETLWDMRPKFGGEEAPEPGRTYALGPDPNKRYEFVVRVADLDELIVSHTDDLQENPAFPAELQAAQRNRGRVAGQTQVQSIAAKLEPTALLDDFNQLDRGMMIVGKDLVVESGNGRTLALRKARAEYPEQWQAYQTALKERLAQYGLSEADLEGKASPVLVRERVSDIDRVAFFKEANEPTTLQMSALEQARLDADLITDNALANLRVGEGWSIDQAIRSGENADFVRSFSKQLPENDRATIMDAKGELSAQGVQRIKAALFTKVFPGEAGQRLAQVFIESAEPEVKNIQNAIYQALPLLSKAEGLVRSGQRDASLSLADDLSKAVDVFARLKRDNVKVGDYLAQIDMFEADLDNFQRELLRFIGENNRSAKPVRELLEGYAEEVLKQGPPGQADLFGAVLTKGELLDVAAKRTTPDREPTFATAEEAPAVTPPGAGLAEPDAGRPEGQPGVTEAPGTTPRPAAPRTTAPIGTVDRLTEPPIVDALLEGYQSQIQPMLRQAEEQLTGQGAVREAIPEKLDPVSEKALRAYLGQVGADITDLKLGATRWAEVRRDAALLNYQRRYGFDNFLGGIMPYEFWGTRTMMRWAGRALNKPSIIANYARIQDFAKRQTEREGFPDRLKRKMQIPLPFLPDWMGEGVFVDPLRQIFPFDPLLQPIRRLEEQNNMEDKRAFYKLSDWLADEEISPEEYAQATAKQGVVWERAVAAARDEINQDLVNPLDFAFMMIGPSLPIQWGYEALRGTPERIGQLPPTRMLQAATGALGIGGARGINAEAWIRKPLGLPAVDRYEDWRVDRMLANLVAEGLVGVDDANRAMIDRQGEAFEMAQQRVAQMGAWQYFGSPLGVDFFPEGEQKQRQLQKEYSKARDLWSAGDDDALTEFFDKYPEYESRLMAFKEPEERLRAFLRSEVWERYHALPDLHKRQVKEQLGDVFTDAFIDPETRSYDSIKTETLAMWSQMLGAHNPEQAQGAPQLPLKLADEKATAAVQAYNEAQSQFFPAGVSWEMLPPEQQDAYSRWRNQYLASHPEAIPYVTGEQSEMYGLNPGVQQYVYQFRVERDQRFSGIFDLQDQYYTLVDPKQKKAFRKANPMLEGYWAWRDEKAAQNPQASPYILSDDSLRYKILGPGYYQTDAKEKSGIDPQDMTPALSRQVAAWMFAGYTLGSGARAALRQIWEKQGKPGDDFDDWLEGLK